MGFLLRKNIGITDTLRSFFKNAKIGQKKDIVLNLQVIVQLTMKLALNFIYQWDLKKQTVLFVSEKIYKAIRKLSIIGKKQICNRNYEVRCYE